MIDDAIEILLVEDDPQAVGILEPILVAKGYSVAVARDGVEGIEQIKIQFPDLILCDIDMPRMNGIELIRVLRAQGVRVPVVIVTAFADKARLKDALNAGAAYLLEKPFATDSLREVLNRVTSINVDLARMVDRALSKKRLTPKEDGVARLVLKGLSSAEIAAITGNSEKTIKQHLTQIYLKFGVEGRAEFFHTVFPT